MGRVVPGNAGGARSESGFDSDIDGIGCES